MIERRATESLHSVGGAYEADAEIVRATTIEEVLAVFRQASESGRRVTLLGGRRSIGDQFLPPPGALGLDVAELGRATDVGRGAEILEEDADGSIWVRTGGGTRFLDLRRVFPDHRPSCPPTTDTVTLAGALAACTHNSLSYFADSVRTFSLVSASGEVYRCARDGDERSRELFFGAIGAFGALGVVTDVEVFLRKVEREQQVVVHAVYAGPAKGGQYLDELERAADDARFSEGAGAVVYGREKHAIVLGDEGLPAGARHSGPRALLTDDDIDGHAVTQGLANRFPRIAEWLVSRTYQPGVKLWAPWYGFLFFQRGYDRAEAVLSRSSFGKKLLRLLGVNPRLPFCHQAWFFPRRDLREVLSLYWEVLGRHRGIEKRAEQQDLVLLPPSDYPSHSSGRTEAPLAVLTSSFAVRVGQPHFARTAEFFAEFTAEAVRRFPELKVSLCKQVHCEPSVLRAMHAGWIERISLLRRELDPQGLVTSQLLDRLGLK